METMTEHGLHLSGESGRRYSPRRIPRVLLALSLLLMLVLPLATPAFAEPVAPLDLSAPAAPGELLIKFKAGRARQARADVVQAHGGRLFDRIAELDVDAATFPALAARPTPRAVEALIDALRR